VALGVGTALTAAGATGTAAAGTAAGAGSGAATGVAGASKWIGSVAVLKWVGAAVTTTAVAVGAAHEYTSLTQETPQPVVTAPRASSAPPRPVSPSVARPRAPEAPAPTILAPAPTAPEPSAIAPIPVAPVPVATAPRAPALVPTPASVARPLPLPPVSAPPAPPASVPDEGTLHDEVAALDRARAALAGGDATGALSAIAAYERAFPRGALADEASMLRIEALARAGRRDDARTEAARWLARDPQSPHARRLRAILAP
jgi:hypothetical protein